MKFSKLLKCCNAFIITSPANLFYLSGYKNADAVIVASNKGAYYITDARYTEESGQAIKHMEIVPAIPSDIFEVAGKLLEGASDIGYEKASVLYADYLKIANLTHNLIDISDKISALRMIKSDKEIEKIQNAQDITDKVFEKILEYIAPNITERQLASKLESLLFEYGADSLAFTSIVASGTNTSKPHAQRTDKPLAKGDLITLDFGARLGGYCSDMTRTVALGHLNEREKEIYSLVLSAQSNALENIQAGISGKEADALARNVFKSKGYEQYFTHSLGHGLGIQVHEPPALSLKSSDILQENMVFSIEPGLYFENKFGIRIEDLVVLGKNGVINLTKSAKDLIIL